MLIAAAVSVILLGGRSSELLANDGADGYAAKLSAKVAEANAYMVDAIPGCNDFTYTAIPRKITHRDTWRINDFYRQVQRFSVIEQVKVAGCGKVYQLNYTAVRHYQDTNLQFLLMMPGETLVGLADQGDAYRLAAHWVMTEHENHGGGTCDQNIFVYDSKRLTMPAGSSPWTEIWSVDVCGYKGQVKLTFRPSVIFNHLEIDPENMP